MTYLVSACSVFVDFIVSVFVFDVLVVVVEDAETIPPPSRSSGCHGSYDNSSNDIIQLY